MEPRGVENLRFDSEFEAELARPFGAQHGRADDEEPLEVEATAQLGPDESGFDGLAQSDFVGDEDAGGGSREEFDEGFELVGVEIGPGTVHAVDDVGEAAREACVG